MNGKRDSIAWHGQSGLDADLNALDFAPEATELAEARVDESAIQLTFAKSENTSREIRTE